MAVNNCSEASIVEIREDQMLDPTCFNANPNPTRRTAYFLKPSLNPNSSPPFPPNIQSFPLPSRPKIMYLCASYPLEGWQTWVQDLEPTHGPLWRKAGIFDAIKASTYRITKNSQLLLRLAERWCPQTNTFVFPWGEASITLQDVFVLGGFSPLGESLLSAASLENNVKQVENKLIDLHRELVNNHGIVSILSWQKRFMGCGNEIEHAGFLVLWLARHVFLSRTASVITKLVFSVAARLSCGIKFDLASPVLASIYRDLTLYKRKIFCSDVCILKLGSPLQLVQVWAWERFPSLGPVPKMINLGETRLACWDNRSRKTRTNIDDIGMSLDSARDTFRWRPYAMSLENWSVPRFYADLETWVIVDSDEEWKIIARFLLVWQLSGFDCVERYNPNRVALQFGYDQDIPDSLEYEKNLNGLRLYIPHRLHEGDVTYRYFNWWNGLNLVEKPLAHLVGCKRKTKTKNRVKKLSKIYNRNDEDVSSRYLSLEEGTRMEEERRNEVRGNKFPHNNAATSQTQPMTSVDTVIEHEVNLMNQGADCMKPSPTLVERKHVSGPLMRREGGSEKFQHIAGVQDKEQILIWQNVMIEDGTEYLEQADKPRNEASTECNISLIGVASEVHAMSVIHENDKPDKADIQVDGQVDISNAEENIDLKNPFAALCREYESRLSELEREISALSVVNVTSTRV